MIRAQIIIPEVDISEAKKERYKPVRLFNSEGIGEDFYLLKSDLEILVEEKVLHPYLAGYQLSVNGTGLLELNQHDSRQSERYARSIAHLEVVSSTGSSFSVTDSVKNIVQRSTSTFVTETETEKEKREDYTLNLRQAKRLDAENAIGSVVDFLARIGIEFDNLNDTLPENISEIVMPDEYSIDTMPLSLSLVENPYSNHINNSFLRLFNNWGATVGNAGNVMWRSFFSGVSAYGLLGMAPVFALRLISMASLATSLTRLFTTVFPVLGNIPGFQNLALAADSVIGINNSWLMLLALVPNLTKTFSSGHHQFSNVQEAYNLGQSVFYGGTKALPGVFDWTNSIWSYVKDLPKQSYLSTSWDLIATVASVGMGVYGFGTGATVLAGLFRAGVALGFTSRLLDFSSLLSNLKDESKSYSISSFFKGIAHHLVYSIQSPAIFAILKLYVAFYTFHMFYLSKTTWDYFFRQVYSGVTAQSLPDFDGLNGGPMSSFIFNRSIEEGASIFDKPFDVPALRGMPLPGAPISAYIILFNFLGAGFSGLSAISNSGMYALSKTKQGIMGCLGYEDSSNDVYRAACWSAFKERSQTSINEVFYKSSSLFIDYKRVGQIWNTSQTWYQGLGRIAKHYVWSGIRDRLFSQSIEARDKASVFTHLASIAYDNVVEKGIKKPANNLVADFQHSKGIQKAWPIAKVASNLALPMLYLYSQYQAGKYENVSGLKLDTAQRVTREGLTAFICSPYGAFVLSNFIKEFTNFPMGMTSTSIMAGMSIPNFRAYAEAKLDRGESTILGSPEGAIRFAISLVAICDFINMFHDHHNLAHWYDAVVLGKDRSVEAVRKVKLEISKLLFLEYKLSDSYEKSYEDDHRLLIERALDKWFDNEDLLLRLTAFVSNYFQNPTDESKRFLTHFIKAAIVSDMDALSNLDVLKTSIRLLVKDSEIKKAGEVFKDKAGLEQDIETSKQFMSRPYQANQWFYAALSVPLYGTKTNSSGRWFIQDWFSSVSSETSESYNVYHNHWAFLSDKNRLVEEIQSLFKTNKSTEEVEAKVLELFYAILADHLWPSVSQNEGNYFNLKKKFSGDAFFSETEKQSIKSYVTYLIRNQFLFKQGWPLFSRLDKFAKEQTQVLVKRGSIRSETVRAYPLAEVVAT